MHLDKKIWLVETMNDSHVELRERILVSRKHIREVVDRPNADLLHGHYFNDWRDLYVHFDRQEITHESNLAAVGRAVFGKLEVLLAAAEERAAFKVIP